MAQNAPGAGSPLSRKEPFGSDAQQAEPHSSTSPRYLIPEVSQEDTTGLSVSPSSAMTTKEQQEYWDRVKAERKASKLLFEIPSARTVEHGPSRYVVYQIVVLKMGSYDSKRVPVERRYSDFERLHLQLRREFCEELEEVMLPRKRLTGNFAEESIAERREAFQEYLAQLYAVRGVRRSARFLAFFTEPELRRAHECLCGGQYRRTLELLLPALDLQEKLARHCPALTVPALCATAVCQRDLDDPAAAFAAASRALPLARRYGLRYGKYRCPLLAMMVDVGFSLGLPVAALQGELCRVRDAQRGPVSQLSLKELVVQEFT